MRTVIIIALVTTLTLVLAVAIARTPKSNNKIAENYIDAVTKVHKTFPTDKVKERFLNLFGDFKNNAIEEIIRNTYADSFYFNDTFKVLYNLDDLVDYMIQTADMVETTTVEVSDVSFSGTDYYIRWIMEMKFKAKNKDIYSKSIGMTQLRFDQEGKIIFHQDYWDSTEGFYQHLPYIGFFLRKIRSNL